MLLRRKSKKHSSKHHQKDFKLLYNTESFLTHMVLFVVGSLDTSTDTGNLIATIKYLLQRITLSLKPPNFKFFSLLMSVHPPARYTTFPHSLGFASILLPLYDNLPFTSSLCNILLYNIEMAGCNYYIFNV